MCHTLIGLSFQRGNSVMFLKKERISVSLRIFCSQLYIYRNVFTAVRLVVAMNFLFWQ